MKRMTIKGGLLAVAIVVWGIVSATDTLSIDLGETLFTQTCKACHQIDKRMVGPALKGVQDRRTDEWIYSFVRSSQSMIRAGDSTAVALFNTYNQVPMPDHALSDVEIGSILAYIRNAEVATAAPEGIPRPAVAPITPSMYPPKFSDYRFWILYTITVVLVIVSIYYKAEMIALRKKVESGSEQL